MKMQYQTVKEFNDAIQVYLWMGADIATNSKDLTITVYMQPEQPNDI